MVKVAFMGHCNAMICKAPEGILPDLVTLHYVRFHISPFIVVDYHSSPLDPEILWGKSLGKLR